VGEDGHEVSCSLPLLGLKEISKLESLGLGLLDEYQYCYQFFANIIHLDFFVKRKTGIPYVVTWNV
jgi:hypothetical protein